MIDMGYDFSISYGYSQYDKLKTSPSKDQQYLFHRAVFRQDTSSLPTDESIQMTLKQRISLIVIGQASLTLQDTYATSDGPVKICTLKPSSEVISLEIGGLGFPKNSPLKPLFDDQIVWLRSSHLINFRSTKCVFASLKNEEQPLNMVKMGGVMVLWGAGTALACCLFLAEIRHFNTRLHRNKRGI
ncbi:uncharacterized protein [Cherax quadricarinatus]|uniref:uncharacterized protein n=1 Tax=Cherax quadricarinatus TaxID=27406 RepID=UPI00387E858B